jgi:choline dehydrogenase
VNEPTTTPEAASAGVASAGRVRRCGRGLCSSSGTADREIPDARLRDRRRRLGRPRPGKSPERGRPVIHWRSRGGLRAPDCQIYFAPVYFWEHGFRKTGAPAITLALGLQAPEARGSVRLRSADPADHPRILNNMLTQDGEIDAYMRALELARELAGTEPLAGLLGEELNPGRDVRSRVELTAWLRATCEHTYHPSRTCRIGPPEEGVIDPELRVYGVEGLCVADASVMPRITSGNTNAPTYMIAGRCVELMLGRPSPQRQVRAVEAASRA